MYPPILILLAIAASAMTPCGFCRGSAAASLHSNQDESNPLETYRREMHGRLVFTRLDADLRDIPVREALAMLARAVDLRIIGRWSDDPIGHGMDPDVAVSLRLDDVRAIDALEMIIDHAALYDACTWQIRAGFIEVGTKRRLSAAAAVERRVYPLTDLLLHPPYFGRAGGKSFDEHPYRPAALWFGNWDGRQTGSEITRELLRGISEIIEIGNWNTGDELVGAIPKDHRFTPGANEDIARRAVATVREWREQQVIIAAPDFIHRQILSRGDAIVPREFTEDDAILRTARSDDGVSFIRPRRVDATDPPRASMFITSHERRTTEDDLKRALAPGASRSAAPNDEALDDGSLPLIRGEIRGNAVVRQLIGTLLSAPVTVEFQETPAREAFGDLARQINVPIIGRYFDDPLGYGIDPEAPITLTAGGDRALAVLIAVLEQCETPHVECTWQIRRGYVEVGTKSRLSVPAARETRLYYIRDLMVNDDPNSRVPPEVLALDVVAEVVTTIEPDAWDWGQPIEPLEADLATSATVGGEDAGSVEGASEIEQGRERIYVEAPKPAIIRFWRDVLIVHAPDYIHRQLAGYPHPDGG